MATLREQSEFADKLIKAASMLREAGFNAQVKILNSDGCLYITFVFPVDVLFDVQMQWGTHSIIGSDPNVNKDIPQMLRMIAQVLELDWKGEFENV